MLNFRDSFGLTGAQSLCLRICTYVIRHIIPHPGEPAIQGEIIDKIKLINSAFIALSAVRATVTTTRSEALRGLSLLLYSELLKDESPSPDFVGQTLPVLRSLLEIHDTSHDALERLGRMVHGLLSTCLLNIDVMRGRQGNIAEKKIKNNMLAAVLILTAIPVSIKVGKLVIEHTCFSITRSLLDAGEMSLAAAHCAKTLIVASTSGNRTLRQCSRLLMPSLIEYIAKVPSPDDPELEVQIAGLSEVWKAFSVFFSSVSDLDRTRVLGILLPAIAILLRASQSTKITSLTVTQLLTFASVGPLAFKNAAGKLDSPTRELLEQAVRRSVGTHTPGSGVLSTKPQISLRSF
jgi:hypothetical protein